MKSHEIRVGNTVRGKHSGKIRTVTSEIIEHASIYEGIELTEDILKLTELKKNYEEWSDPKHRDGFAMLELTKTTEGFGLSVNNQEYDTGCIIKYLHHLEGLWFDLTGEELKVKL